MRSRSTLVVGLVLALGAGCGEPEGTVVDGGGAAPDAASGDDGGREVDAGTAAGDGGGASDAGGVVDSGAGADSGIPTACDAPLPDLTGERISMGAFQEPVFLAQPSGSTDLYVVERRGRVLIVRGGTTLGTPFLDIRSQTGGYGSAGGDERGLLSIAFHPDYATNGRFFLGLTPTDGRTVNLVAEGRRSAGDPDVAEAAITTVLESANDSRPNHNGGFVAFGPDGYLYVGFGDGGGANDPDRTGQNLGTLFAKILRVDVDGATPYAIPSTNPFRGVSGAREEIWAYGVRNPWRFSFDRASGDLWIADVGQNLWEEIDVQPAGSMGGENYGWNAFEGDHSFRGGVPLRAGSTHTAPVYEYAHESADTTPDNGVSVTGGYVYRGTAIPSLAGAYVFADLNGSTAGFRLCDGAPAALRTFDGLNAIPGRYIVSFAEDQSGQLYVLFASGEVYRIIAA